MKIQQCFAFLLSLDKSVNTRVKQMVTTSHAVLLEHCTHQHTTTHGHMPPFCLSSPLCQSFPTFSYNPQTSGAVFSQSTCRHVVCPVSTAVDKDRTWQADQRIMRICVPSLVNCSARSPSAVTGPSASSDSLPPGLSFIQLLLFTSSHCSVNKSQLWLASADDGWTADNESGCVGSSAGRKLSPTSANSESVLNVITGHVNKAQLPDSGHGMPSSANERRWLDVLSRQRGKSRDSIRCCDIASSVTRVELSSSAAVAVSRSWVSRIKQKTHATG